MKLNKKGFTLVELLAVIVVLAIIALIGFTSVGGIIDSTKKNAAASTASNFEHAAKTYCGVKMTELQGSLPTAVTSSGEIDFDNNGSTVTYTKVSFADSCDTVTIEGLTINTYSCTKTGNKWKCE